MAMYHLSVKYVSRRQGRFAVAAAAYRSGQKLYDKCHGSVHDYSQKLGVAHSEILLPDTAPRNFLDRQTLWNAVESAEKRCDARTAREVEIALPVEFDRKLQIEIVREYTRDSFVTRGMCVDFSLHDKADGNPHVHIMLTTRRATPEGFGKKDRTWNDRENVEAWRKQWADICNRKFKQHGINERIDHRTLKEQGLDREPTIHLGPTVKTLERIGIPTDRGEINRAIRRCTLCERRQQDAENMRKTSKADVSFRRD